MDSATESSGRASHFGAHIDLDQCRKLAKDLLKGFAARDRRALDQIRWNHPRFRRKSDDDMVKQRFVLADAQLVVARLQHIESWPKLLAHVESVRKGDPAISRFERAADAIVTGDIETLRSMLHESPTLVRERSTRTHRSTLLHYVSANGIEDVRQVTPPNILEIAALLLDAGADVNATSDAYGGGSTTLGLTSTSAHPRLAGVQLPLMDLLIDRGATIGSLVEATRGCVANGCPEAAVHLVERGATADTLYGAAGLGRLDAVQRLFDGADVAEREAALLIAAQCNRTEVAEFLLTKGVDARAFDGMPALHWAASHGNIPLMERLVALGADLESENEFGGRALGNTMWFAFHALDRDFVTRDYIATIEWLIAHGARTDRNPQFPDNLAALRRRAAALTGGSRE